MNYQIYSAAKSKVNQHLYSPSRKYLSSSTSDFISSKILLCILIPFLKKKKTIKTLSSLLFYTIYTDFPGGPVVRTPCPIAGRGMGSIPSQGTRSHMPQLDSAYPKKIFKR